MHRIARLGLAEDQDVNLATFCDDGVSRKMMGLKVVTYNIRKGASKPIILKRMF
jgi:hypothetical protein